MPTPLYAETLEVAARSSERPSLRLALSRRHAEQRRPVPAGGWSRHSSERIATVAALRGRDRLRLALSALGFALR